MKLTRLRLHGFKSFVEPTDFVIEAGPHRRGRAERLRQIESGRGVALGDGRDLAQIAARRRHGCGYICRLRQPPLAQPRRSGDDDRQYRSLRAGGHERSGDAGNLAPDRTRSGIGLSNQWPRRARSRRADPVRRRRHRRAFAGAGAPGQDRRNHSGQTRTAPPRAGRCRRRRRPSCPPPRGRIAPQGRRNQPYPRRGRDRSTGRTD